MTARKLPAHDVLRAECIAGSSYTDLAIKYKVGRSVIPRTLRKHALREGLPWPIVRTDDARRRSLASRKYVSMDASPIKWALEEHFAKKNGDTVGALAVRASVDPSWLSAVKNGRRARVKREVAARVLQAIGEQPHESLLHHAPIVSNKSYGTMGRSRLPRPTREEQTAASA